MSGLFEHISWSYCSIGPSVKSHPKGARRNSMDMQKSYENFRGQTTQLVHILAKEGVLQSKKFSLLTPGKIPMKFKHDFLDVVQFSPSRNDQGTAGPHHQLGLVSLAGGAGMILCDMS
jgi:hypothetical protein